MTTPAARGWKSLTGLLGANLKKALQFGACGAAGEALGELIIEVNASR